MKPHHHAAVASAALPNTRQRLYIRYYVAITADLIVLGLLSQFWDRVQISSFTSGLVAAILLQLLLQLTLWIEHAASQPFKDKTSWQAKAGRVFVAWFILFSSKLVMLWTIGLILGDSIHFYGALHGALPFIATVVCMILAEELAFRTFGALESPDEQG
ncbi:MAG: hypothetical protein P8O91_04440 [Luminiphilus sp.]|nr:hypothetical protein [Luminiphilus sp.]